MFITTNAPHPAPLVLVLTLAFALGGCASSGPIAGAVDPQEQHRRRSEAAQMAIDALQAQRKGRLDEAIQLYAQALNLSPDLPGVRTNLGVALMEKQNYLEAAEVFKAEAAISPLDPRPLVNLGVAYLNRGWAQEAIQYFDRALAREPNNLQALRGRLEAARRLGVEDEETLSLVHRALLIEEDPRWLEELRWRKVRLESVVAGRK